jgi:hypothetical protein
MGLDVMLKACPGTPGLSEHVFLDVETADAGILIEAC